MWSIRKVETSLTISPPTSIRSNASSIRRMSFVKMPACSPNSLLPAASIASQTSAKRFERRPPARTPPRTRRAFLVDRREHRRLPHAAVALAAGEHVAPAARASREPLLDALGVGVVDQRADVRRLVERVADHERARSAGPSSSANPS